MAASHLLRVFSAISLSEWHVSMRYPSWLSLTAVADIGSRRIRASMSTLCCWKKVSQSWMHTVTCMLYSLLLLCADLFLGLG